MSFACNECKKTFTTKQSLQYHMKQKVCLDEDGFCCSYCKKNFTTKTSMYRHIRTTCKKKKEIEIEKEKIYDRLLKLEEENKKITAENKTLKEKVYKIEKNVKTTKKTMINTNSNNTNSNNTTYINNGTINNNTVLVGFGSENMSKLDRDEIVKALKGGYFAGPALTEIVHFNPKYPENHNVYIANIKNEYGMMFDGETWTLVPKDELIKKIYGPKKVYIEKNVDKFADSLSRYYIKCVDRWLDDEDESEDVAAVKNKIKLLLYNKRHIPINTRKLIEAKNNEQKVITPE